MNENKAEANKWLELFKTIVEKESNYALSVNDLVTSINNTLNGLIEKCN